MPSVHDLYLFSWIVIMLKKHIQKPNIPYINTPTSYNYLKKKAHSNSNLKLKLNS